MEEENPQIDADNNGLPLPEPIVEVELSKQILSVVWGGGNIGAAYYQLETSELFLFPDTAESSPDFEILRTLFKQVSPKVIIGCSRQDSKFIAMLKQLTGDSYTENENQTPSRHSSLNRDLPNLFIESGKEFAPDPCKRRLQAIHLPDEPRSHDARQHLFYITSLIPFSNLEMVRAAGALLKFLDKRGIELLQAELKDGQIPVINVKLCTMDDLVLVDYTAWDSLQIFNQDIHPSSAKQGNSGSKEGLSIFGLFNKCLTSQGLRYMRLQLLHPTRNFAVLKRRYDVIEHCVNPAHTGFVEATTNCLKSIKNIPKLLLKLSLLHTTVREWKDFYQTLYKYILLGEICAAQPDVIEVFNDIAEACKSDAVNALSQEMQRIIDFEQSDLHGRFYPRHGINEDLDAKRQQYQVLPEVMSFIAAEEIAALPGHVKECSLLYIPEVGYLLAIKLCTEDLANDVLVLEGFEYRFTNGDQVYYKSPRTLELDAVLGDSQVAIFELETYIMIALADNIMKNSTFLLKINSLVSELDSLMTMAAVARDRRFVRPTVVEGKETLQIVGGRHPLVELSCDFVPNSTIFTEDEKIVILTGPNASGKSIYLKQIGIVVIMGLCGSFVPAVSAVIPAFDRICTRIYAHESIAVGLSTFMIDINQMSLALRNASRSSLVIVDEFGKGTSEADGLSLLQATLEYFGQRGLDSPVIFVSTHYFTLMNRLPALSVFKPQTMDFMIEGDRLVYLFKLKEGVCQSSFAFNVAQDAGLSEEVVARSLQIEKVLRQEISENDIVKLKFQEEKEVLMLSIADQFLSLNLSEVNCAEYLELIASNLKPFMEIEDVILPPAPESVGTIYTIFSDNPTVESDQHSSVPRTPPTTPMVMSEFDT